MYRGTDTVAVTPREAIAALVRAFAGDYAVDHERLFAAIAEASVPGSERSRNHIVRVIRMCMELGLKSGDLAAAVAELRATGREHLLSSSRLTNPYGNELVESAVEPSSIRGLKDGRLKFEHLLKHGIAHPDFKDVRREPAPPIGTSVNLLIEQEFECSVVMKPSVFAEAKGVKDPYGRGYPDLLRALIRHIRLSLQRENHGGRDGISASFLELSLYEEVALHPLTRRWLERQERDTPGDFLALPIQTGKRWRGSSMARVAWHCEHADFRIGLFGREAPLPAYVALFELWVDPYRLKTDSLAIDCPGDIVRERSGPLVSGLSLVHGCAGLHLIPRDRHRPDPAFAPATGVMQ